MSWNVSQPPPAPPRPAPPPKITVGWNATNSRVELTAADRDRQFTVPLEPEAARKLAQVLLAMADIGAAP